MKLDNVKIVYFDLETSYNTVASWGCGKQYVTDEQILKERQIISAAWMWEGETRVYDLDWGLHKQDDYQLCKKLVKELSKADLIIGQNSDKFDIKRFRTHLWDYGLPNLGCITTLDTLKLSRTFFGHNSNKLDYVVRRMVKSGKIKLKPGEPAGKIKMCLQDWKDIIEHKDPKALEKMRKYGRKDVRDTRAYFHSIRPYIDIGRLLGSLQHKDDMKMESSTGKLVSDPTLCPDCGPKSTTVGFGTRTLRSGKRYQRRQCTTCHLTFKGEPL
jgi:hypothetical protein